MRKYTGGAKWDLMIRYPYRHRFDLIVVDAFIGGAELCSHLDRLETEGRRIIQVVEVQRIPCGENTKAYEILSALATSEKQP